VQRPCSIYSILSHPAPPPSERSLIIQLLDTHIHASQYPNAGIFGTSTLLSWLQTYTFPLEASLADPTKAHRVYTRAIRSTLSHGTTTAAFYATLHVDSTNLLASLCLAAGQRAFIGRCNQDSHLHPDYYRDFSAQSALDDTHKTIGYCRSIDPEGKIVQPIITPRFAPSCTKDLLYGLGKMAKDDPTIRIQTHISENTSEVALVKDLFPESPSYAAVYDEVGLLTDRTILAHAVHLTDDERALVKKRDAKISHCPPSNSSLGSGLCHVRKYLDDGITVGLGTDVSGGYSASILEAARQAAMVSRLVGFHENTEGPKLTVPEILYLATKGGAKVVGLEDKIGGFEKGMEWDAQVIELDGVGDGGEQGDVGGQCDFFGWESWEDTVAKWFYGGDDRNVRAVYVAGRLVHERS
jgi:guanine deaminase